MRFPGHPFFLGLGMVFPQPMLVAAGGSIKVALIVSLVGAGLMAVGLLRRRTIS